MSKSKEGI